MCAFRRRLTSAQCCYHRGKGDAMKDRIPVAEWTRSKGLRGRGDLGLGVVRNYVPVRSKFPDSGLKTSRWLLAAAFASCLSEDTKTRGPVYWSTFIPSLAMSRSQSAEAR